MSINEELNNKISGNSTQGLQGPSLSNVVFPIALKKRQHSARGVREVLDTSFNDFEPNNKDRDIERFFKLHDELFFDIPKEGEKSHTILFVKSRDFLRDYIDPKDNTILELTEEIADLNEEILNLRLQLLSGSSQITIPTSDQFLPDENEDNIPDIEQDFSNFGSPRRLILVPSNNDLKKILKNPNCEYYKDKFYGQQIYKFKKKVNKKKNRFVIYEGSKGKKGKRYIRDLNSGNSYKIGKRHWKSKNREKIFKPPVATNPERS
jgi:hypothetical protein